MENWRFIKENNDYMVSDHGRIMSLKKPQKKILSSSLLHNGYEAIYIYQKGIHAARYVHRLVAETFIPNPKKLPQVNHLDGNTLNNHVSNLEWCDAYDNLMHAIRTGLRPVNVPRSIPCAVTDESGTILHPYPSMRSMVKEEKLNSAQYSWLQLKLTHPERVRLHTMRRWHLPYLPIPRLHPRPPLRHPAILPAPVRRRGRRTGVQLPERPKGERHSLNYQQFKINKRKEIFKMKDAIIIHCSATRAEQDITAADIESWHRAHGFWTIGYHYVIRLDGTIEPGRDVTLDGAHCMGWNKRAIGICYVGGLDKDGRPADTRTDAQRTALIRLVKALRLVFPGVKQVLGHRDTSPDLNGDGVISPNEYMKACPCFDVQKEGF